jgi:TrbC/VIRB2 pilin
MSMTLTRSQLALWGLAAAALAFALLLLDPPSSHAALSKMAGYSTADGATTFDKVNEYMTNLRNGLMPLSLPIGSVGLVAGGAMYALGNQMASRVLFGVLIGVGLALSAPNIVS